MIEVGKEERVVVLEEEGFPNIAGGFGVVDPAPNTGVVVPEALAPSPLNIPLDALAAGGAVAFPNIPAPELDSTFAGTTIEGVAFAAPKKSGTLDVVVASLGDSFGAAGAPNENPPDGFAAGTSAGFAGGAEKRFAGGVGAEAGAPKLNEGFASTFVTGIVAAGALAAAKSDGGATAGGVTPTGRRGGAATAGTCRERNQQSSQQKKRSNEPRMASQQTCPLHRTR